MKFKGHSAVEELSELLEKESIRCLVIVSAAFFDETLGRLLGDTVDRALFVRIEDGAEHGVLTPDEKHDLHSIRQLRNSFAHDLRMDAFNSEAATTIENLKIWRTAVNALPEYKSLLPTTGDRLLYVVAVVAFRLQHRKCSNHKCGPLAEPEFKNTNAFPPLIAS